MGRKSETDYLKFKTRALILGVYSSPYCHLHFPRIYVIARDGLKLKQREWSSWTRANLLFRSNSKFINLNQLKGIKKGKTEKGEDLVIQI